MCNTTCDDKDECIFLQRRLQAPTLPGPAGPGVTQTNLNSLVWSVWSGRSKPKPNPKKYCWVNFQLHRSFVLLVTRGFSVYLNRLRSGVIIPALFGLAWAGIIIPAEFVEKFIPARLLPQV